MLLREFSFRSWETEIDVSVSSKTSTSFLKDFSELYKESCPFSDDSTEREMTGFAVMHQKSLELITNAEQLVAIFENVEKDIIECDMVGVLDNEWRDEDATIENLLAEGYEVGVRKHWEIMSGRRSEGEPEADHRVGPVFYSEERVVDGAIGAWGRVARKQGKAIRRLVKSTFVEAA